MHRRFFLAAALAASLAVASTAAAEDKDYPLVPLMSGGVNVIGETIKYPTTGPAHVTAAVITLAPGAATIEHEHGVPLFAYILDGELTVDYGAHGKRTYRKGDAFMEAMAVPHAGTNTGTTPVRLLAVYMGAEGAKDTIPVKSRQAPAVNRTD